MAHIHTNPGEHDHTASAFIMRVDGSGPKLLLHVHKKLGVLLQPGGHIELTETPWQAILHEIKEETGYNPTQLKVLQPKLRLKKLKNAVLHPQTIVHNTHHFDSEGVHRHSDISYAFIANSDPIHSPDDGESTKFRWVNAKELKALSSEEMYDNVRAVGLFALEEILPNWEAVELSEFEA